jgi:hypothetical protein
MDDDEIRLSVGVLRKILQQLPDNADVIIRPREELRPESLDYFVRTAFPWVYDNKMEALVLIPE